MSLHIAHSTLHKNPQRSTGTNFPHPGFYAPREDSSLMHASAGSSEVASTKVMDPTTRIWAVECGMGGPNAIPGMFAAVHIPRTCSMHPGNPQDRIRRHTQPKSRMYSYRRAYVLHRTHGSCRPVLILTPHARAQNRLFSQVSGTANNLPPDHTKPPHSCSCVYAHQPLLPRCCPLLHCLNRIEAPLPPRHVLRECILSIVESIKEHAVGNWPISARECSIMCLGDYGKRTTPTEPKTHRSKQAKKQTTSAESNGQKRQTELCLFWVYLRATS